MKNDTICKKIAIIHYEWYFQEHGRLLAEGFLSKGNIVDMYFYNMKGFYTTMPQSDKCTIIKKESKNSLSILGRRVLHFLYRRCHALQKCIEAIYDFLLFIELHQFRFKKKYDLIIGVEKGGALLAYKASEINHSPFIYYSLELSDKQDFSYELLLGAMARQEKCITRHASGVILQDTSRAEFFTNMYPTDNIIFLPVSVRKSDKGGSIKQKSCIAFGNNHFFEEKDFLLLSQSLPSGWQVILHNHSQAREKKIVDRLKLRNIIISESFLSDKELDLLLSSASIGLAFYSDRDENVKRIIFSSEKIARYLSCDLPFLTNDLGNASLLFNEIPCGIAVNSIQEINKAITKIEGDYQAFVSAAKKAFNVYYNFDENFERIYPQLIELASQDKN